MRKICCFVCTNVLSVSLALAGACNSTTTAATEFAAPAGDPHEPAGRSAVAPKVELARDAGTHTDASVVLECEQGGHISVVHAEFHCGSVTVYTCKDLSNVVLEFEDGQIQRFEGLSGHSNTFSGTGANSGKRVTRVWIKAGANKSGEGPGYGERSDAPEDDCRVPSAGSGGIGGQGGAGGSNEQCVVGPDLQCVGQPIAGGGATGGAGSGPSPE